MFNVHRQLKKERATRIRYEEIGNDLATIVWSQGLTIETQEETLEGLLRDLSMAEEQVKDLELQVALLKKQLEDCHKAKDAPTTTSN